MQFLVMGYDALDEAAAERRLAARQQHLDSMNELRESGNILYAAAILNDKGQMCGSAIVASFESRKKLDQWLEVEPYVSGKVWDKIVINECRVAPAFMQQEHQS